LRIFFTDGSEIETHNIWITSYWLYFVSKQETGCRAFHDLHDSILCFSKSLHFIRARRDTDILFANLAEDKSQC
jgi:hypothetical protein